MSEKMNLELMWLDAFGLKHRIGRTERVGVHSPAGQDSPCRPGAEGGAGAATSGKCAGGGPTYTRGGIRTLGSFQVLGWDNLKRVFAFYAMGVAAAALALIAEVVTSKLHLPVMRGEGRP